MENAYNYRVVGRNQSLAKLLEAKTRGREWDPQHMLAIKFPTIQE